MTRQSTTKSASGKRFGPLENKNKLAPARRRQAKPDASRPTPIDEDLHAIQHEVHGMIEDAQPAAAERAGGNIQTE